MRGIPGARQPWRVVLTRSGKLLCGKAHLFTDAHSAKTLVYQNKSLRAVLRDLGKQQITSVLIEGGADILGQAYLTPGWSGIEAHFYIAPLLIGGPKVTVAGRGAGANVDAARIKTPRYDKIGDDLHIFGQVEYPG